MLFRLVLRRKTDLDTRKFFIIVNLYSLTTSLCSFSTGGGNRCGTYWCSLYDGTNCVSTPLTTFLRRLEADTPVAMGGFGGGGGAGNGEGGGE